MVEIVGKSEEEVRKHNRLQNLDNFIRDFFKDNHIEGSPDFYCVGNIESGNYHTFASIDVDPINIKDEPIDLKIKVSDPEYLGRIVDFAEKYEEATGEKVRLVKDYFESN